MRAFIFLFIAVLGAAACEDTAPARDFGTTGVADMSSGPDLSSTDLAAAIEFEDFVLGLINTQTADTSKPTTTEDKVFTDSMDPSKFNGLFP